MGYTEKEQFDIISFFKDINVALQEFVSDPLEMQHDFCDTLKRSFIIIIIIKLSYSYVLMKPALFSSLYWNFSVFDSSYCACVVTP